MQQEWNSLRIWNLTHSFMESRIFLTGFELGLFDLLSNQSLTIEEVSYHCGTNQRKVAMILDALTTIGAMQLNGSKYSCVATLIPLVARDSDNSVNYTIQHAADLWRRWADLTEIVKTDPLQEPLLESNKQAVQVSANATGNPLTSEMVNLINPLTARQMLMIGITTTSFLFPFLRIVPGMSVTLFDKKEKIDAYRKWLSEVVNGNEQTQIIHREVPTAPFVLHRVSFLPGDPLINTLPYGFDFAIMSSVVQQYFFHQNIELLRKTFNALLPGGRVVIREILCAPERNNHYFSAVYSVNSLVETRGKPPYTFEEVKTALEQAGFIGVRLLNPETWMDGVIEAYKPLSAQA